MSDRTNTTDNEISTVEETAEEKDLRESVEKDEFQKGLDEAIEQKRLSEYFPALYQFDSEQLEVEIERFGVKYRHLFAAPQTIDEVRKEAMAVTIRRNAGKFQGDPMVEAIRDDSNAMKRFYNGLAKEVWGYPINEGDEPEKWRAVVTVVDEASAPVEAVTAETNGNGHDVVAKTLLDYIPDADKLMAAAKIHGSSNFVLAEKGKRIRSIRDRREYNVKQLFGVERDDDGNVTRPKNVVAYTFNEAAATDIGFFDTKCQPSKTLIKKEGEPEQRSVINIESAEKLFDKLITFIQGGTVDGKEVLIVEQGDSRLKKIPVRCKVDAVFVYMNFLKS
jgi:hypothetical protein